MVEHAAVARITGVRFPVAAPFSTGEAMLEMARAFRTYSDLPVAAPFFVDGVLRCQSRKLPQADLSSRRSERRQRTNDQSAGEERRRRAFSTANVYKSRNGGRLI